MKIISQPCIAFLPGWRMGNDNDTAPILMQPMPIDPSNKQITPRSLFFDIFRTGLVISICFAWVLIIICTFKKNGTISIKSDIFRLMPKILVEYADWYNQRYPSLKSAQSAFQLFQNGLERDFTIGAEVNYIKKHLKVC